ncbi:MAG: glutamine synthetase type III [Cryomorphaceae bacterium]|nr:glutamine synthetase type III [Cryomorphaceae bacterium]
MSTLRFNSILESTSHKPINFSNPYDKSSEYFGSHVFNMNSMREYMPKEAFESVKNAIDKGEKINLSVADQVATAMKSWSISKGATHYTHWFQPLTGSTAEKHDGFFEPTSDGFAIEKFSGSMLVQAEPDASSFPNGGIRNTFEARGYTAWDPTSPAFVFGSTLCIPTIFVAYTGEALDNKVPLLRSLQSLDKAATDVAQYFDKNISKVNATLGWEQEYFLVDETLFMSRPDLVMTGRTLVGHSPAKGQQLDDHYFGSIPERVMSYMREIEFECHKMGIPVKTRHNEVAPGQFEFAPVFEEANIAVDHNSLFMDILEKVARRHMFRVLLHEKPFSAINGSGKHNNWSLSSNTGLNLLAPGKTPKRNLLFLTFFINTIKAVNDQADLIRAAIASASNDHRLGANEAPPAIISVFIGSQLSQVLDELEKLENGKLSPEKKTDLKLNVVGKIPEILLDNTDRNRTSPFAFTGNKFELRAVGSTANCSVPMTTLNMIVADQLSQFKASVDKLVSEGLKKDDAIFNMLREYIKSSKNIRFEGDGYSQEWKEIASQRGLKNTPDTPRALDFYLSKSSIDLFEKTGVLNKVEIEARYEILQEEYFKSIQIESRTLGDLVKNHIVPTSIRYQSTLSENVNRLKKVLEKDVYEKVSKEQIQMIVEISQLVSEALNGVNEMTEARKVANKIDDLRKKSLAYCDKVKPYLEKIRYSVDKLELLVDNEIWPLAKYREILYIR